MIPGDRHIVDSANTTPHWKTGSGQEGGRLIRSVECPGRGVIEGIVRMKPGLHRLSGVPSQVEGPDYGDAQSIADDGAGEPGLVCDVRKGPDPSGRREPRCARNKGGGPQVLWPRAGRCPFPGGEGRGARLTCPGPPSQPGKREERRAWC